VVFKPTPEAAAQQIERWVHYYVREVMKTSAGLLKAMKEL
jgi:hypothetical protein